MSGDEALRALLIASSVLAGLYVAFRLWVAAVGRALRVERPYDDRYELETADGFGVGLYRYRRPPDAGATERLPVLLCHGLGANRHNLDLTDGSSLARAIQSAGFDTFVVELRSGRRSSWRGHAWTFDDLWRFDVDVAIRRILELTGAPQVHWVGYSMGGMLGYAYLQEGSQPDTVASFVAIGAPATFAHGRRFRLLLWLSWLVEWMPGIAVERVARAFAVLAPVLPSWAMSVMYHPDNADPALRRVTMGNLIADIPRPLVRQLRAWVGRGGRFGAPDGAIDYLAGLSRVTTPSLLVAGSRDMLAPPESVKAAYEASGAECKRFRVMARVDGEGHHYGHADLCTGRHAPTELFPLVTRWLLEREESRLDA